MNQFIIKEDYIKCSLYLILNLIISLIFFIMTSISLTQEIYILTFTSITILWFSIKYMIRFGKILFKNIPICTFDNSAILINYDNDKFIYKNIIHVEIIRNKFSIKLLIKSLLVEHPSKYYYVNIAYIFKQKQLKNIEDKIVNILKENKVEIIKMN